MATNWFSLQSSWQQASETLLRFPWVLLSALALTVTGILSLESTVNEDAYFRLMMPFTLGIGLFYALVSYQERYAQTGRYAQFLPLAVLAFLVLFYLVLPQKLTFIQYTRFAVLFIAFHLLISYAPFLWHKEINGFWQYNQELFLRILLSALYSFVLFAGLGIALASIDILLEVKIPPKRYGQLWMLITGLFNTWFFLAGVPEQVEKLENEGMYPRGLKIFTQYVLLPLVSLYMLILYVYTGKILITWNLPKGWVSYLVIAFSVSGILSLLLIHPIRNESGNQWIRIYSRTFYFIMLPVIALLFVAIGRRVADYGITELRYYVLLIASWLTFISVYFLTSKVQNIKIIPFSLSILLLLSCFGPWSAFSVSEGSQYGRLKTILQKNQLLDDGKISQNIAEGKKIEREDLNQLNDILLYLAERDRLVALQKLFKENIKTIVSAGKGHYVQKEEIMEYMGGEVASFVSGDPGSFQKYLYFNSQREQDFIKVRNYEYYVELNVYERNAGESKETRIEDEGQVYRIKADFRNDRLHLFKNNANAPFVEVKFDQLIRNLLKKYKGESADAPASEMTLMEEGNEYKIKLLITSLNVVQKSGKEAKLAGLQAKLLFSVFQ